MFVGVSKAKISQVCIHVLNKKTQNFQFGSGLVFWNIPPKDKSWPGATISLRVLSTLRPKLRVDKLPNGWSFDERYRFAMFLPPALAAQTVLLQLTALPVFFLVFGFLPAGHSRFLWAVQTGSCHCDNFDTNSWVDFSSQPVNYVHKRLLATRLAEFQLYPRSLQQNLFESKCSKCGFQLHPNMKTTYIDLSKLDCLDSHCKLIQVVPIEPNLKVNDLKKRSHGESDAARFEGAKCKRQLLVPTPTPLEWSFWRGWARECQSWAKTLIIQKKWRNIIRHNDLILIIYYYKCLIY